MNHLKILTFGFIAIGTTMANAALTFTFTEEGDNVVMRSMGSIDLTFATFVSDSNNLPILNQIGTERIESTAGNSVVFDLVRGVDLLPTSLTTGFRFASSATSGGSFYVNQYSLGIFADNNPSIVDDHMLNITHFTTNKQMVWIGEDFTSMGLDAHLQDTAIGLWAARDLGGGAYSDLETINFVVSSVPEPSSVVLFGLGSFALIARRNRK